VHPCKTSGEETKLQKHQGLGEQTDVYQKRIQSANVERAVILPAANESALGH
jgi:hypothetical protein